MDKYRLMLFKFEQQLTQNAAVSIARYFNLPASIVDKIQREYPGTTLVMALEQQGIMCEDEDKLRDLHTTLKAMQYYDLAGIIEVLHPQFKQVNPQRSDEAESPVISNSGRSDFGETSDEGRSVLFPAGMQDFGKTEKTPALSPIEFQEYLESVGLGGQFPGKMTLKIANRIRLLDGYHTGLKQADLPFLFLTMLTSLDRRVIFPEKLNFNDSVRDFICALLHCSDDFLRQHILEKLSACQLAVPIIIPHPTMGNPTFLLWALRRVVREWKNGEDLLSFERNMVTEYLFTVAFLRIGELPVSKSHILNNMFGRAQNNAPTACFISKREDYQGDATFSKGSLEAHWYVPLKAKNGEILDKVTLFLNLRGDSKEFPLQVTFASKAANMVFILVDKESELQNKTFIENIQQSPSNVVIVSFTERMKNTSIQSRKKLSGTDSRLEYEADGEDIALSKTLCELIKTASHQQNSKHYQCIEDWAKICRSLKGIIVDEDNHCCLQARQFSKKVFTQMSSLSVQHIKGRHMTLQNLELEWIHWDQKKSDKNELFSEQVFVRILTTQSEIRMKQLSCWPSLLMETFYHTLHAVIADYDRKYLHYFMAHFQSQIEEKEKREILVHITKLNELEKEMARMLKMKAEKGKSSKEPLDSIIAKLHLDIVREREEYSNTHIGFEHFMREFSCLFEAQYSHHKSIFGDYRYSFHHRSTIGDNLMEKIPALGARLLIEGYPLEILNGNTGYIQMRWISNVMNNVEKLLNSPNIFVISIIGIQGSGKSTLLNSMFGVRFTVRHRSCTRGIFLQMLEVDELLQGPLGFQYLLIMDTEGLQSPTQTLKNDLKFDNLLATLAMCVVDLAIVNIPQETIGRDIIGILQIAVQAAIRNLRMKVQVVSRCLIVHQRVSNVEADVKNTISMNIMKNALDKATLVAAEKANITGINGFSDVFPLLESENVYIPCLWMGNMSAPNHLYSEIILNLKSQILSMIGDTLRRNEKTFTFRDFQRKLEDIWDTLKEDFLFG